ncbi:MAG: hypothetical protein NTY48_06415 [Candidatus Diapherotrites archaeon]|nr:hypothetical protein [Candidatus Diapherotrites archaeon]
MIRSLGKKKVSAVQARRFWRDFDAGKKRYKLVATAKDGRRRIKPRKQYFDQTGVWLRKPVAITSAMAATVRTFNSIRDLEKFIERVKLTNKHFLANPPHLFDFQPLELLSIDKKNLRIAERVIPAPSIVDLMEAVHEKKRLSQKSRYGNILNRKIGFDSMPIKQKQLIVKKILDIVAGIIATSYFDAYNAKIFVTDFNLKTGRPTLAFANRE